MHVATVLSAACVLIPPAFARVDRRATPTISAPLDGYGPLPTGWKDPYQWGCDYKKHYPRHPVFELIHYHDNQECYKPLDRFDKLGGWEEHEPPDSLCGNIPRGPLWPQLIRYTFEDLENKPNCQTMHLRDSVFGIGGGWIGDNDGPFHKIIFQRVRHWDKDGIEKEHSPTATTCKVSVYPWHDYGCNGAPVAVFGDDDDRTCLEVTGENVKVECRLRGVRSVGR